MGPNFANYDSAFYRNFMTFARDNDCLPDVVSWHELNDDFFAGWYSRYDDYRSIESSLGITPREICINEYCRIKGDLGIPGQLVQWVVRFEASKVDACLAYWTSAGCLNDLVARDTDNQPTGGWWLYKWYGSLTGHTVRVTPPDANAEGLQGLASVDSEASQVRVLFGGSNGCADVVVKGLDFGESAHAVVWETASTGINPSHGPMVVMEGNYAVTQNRLIVGMDGMVDTSAYQMIVTPARDSLDGVNSHRYWAKYEAPSNNASSNFVVTAASNGYYQVRLGYFAGVKGFPETTQNMRIALNDSSLIDLPMPVAAGGENGASANIHLFLTAGINRLSFIPLLQSDGVAAPLEFIELTPARGEVARYEAEDALLGGTAEVIEDPAASGGKCVGSIGSGTENTLQFNHLLVPINGTYCMVVTFANGEFKGAHQYNNNVVDRFADISVNGGLPSRVFFRNTFAWNTYRTTLVKVELHAGENTVKFSNPLAAAPNIDRIEIALLCDSLVNDNGIPLSPTTQSD